MKRLKKELQESVKRKTERPAKETLKRLQFTGKPIDNIEKIPKPRRRPRKGKTPLN